MNTTIKRARKSELGNAENVCVCVCVCVCVVDGCLSEGGRRGGIQEGLGNVTSRYTGCVAHARGAGSVAPTSQQLIHLIE